MKHDVIAVVSVSALLLVYTIMATIDTMLGWALLIAGVSPLLVIWMVWVVIKHGEYMGPELEEDQEYGYLDR